MLIANPTVSVPRLINSTRGFRISSADLPAQPRLHHRQLRQLRQHLLITPAEAAADQSHRAQSATETISAARAPVPLLESLALALRSETFKYMSNTHLLEVQKMYPRSHLFRKEEQSSIMLAAEQFTTNLYKIFSGISSMHGKTN